VLILSYSLFNVFINLIWATEGIFHFNSIGYPTEKKSGRQCIIVSEKPLPNSLYRMITVQTVLLLTLSNIFMTFAWYAHLRHLNDKAWYIAAILSWSIALFEYLLQVPANRIGYTHFSLPQLKILQELITLSVFMGFAYFYMDIKPTMNYLWASLCLLAAVFFIFRS
jgi:uncharacterized protein (DUF486 family)